MYHFYNCLNQSTRLLVQEDAFGFFLLLTPKNFDQNIIQKNKKECSDVSVDVVIITMCIRSGIGEKTRRQTWLPFTTNVIYRSLTKCPSSVTFDRGLYTGIIFFLYLFQLI
jgi:hypothetical protein